MVIAAMVALGTLDWWHADDEDGAVVLHDHSAHHRVFGATRATRVPEHCVLCHWLRTLSNGVGVVSQYRVASSSGRQVLHFLDNQPAQLTAAILPARAPPAPPAPNSVTE
jgi:hypothetical protein